MIVPVKSPWWCCAAILVYLGCGRIGFDPNGGGDGGRDGSPILGDGSLISGTESIYIKAANSGFGDWFGHRVVLSRDGTTLAVAAPSEASTSPGINGDQTNNAASGCGAVYVFARSASSWVQQAYVKASNPTSYDYFGHDIALSDDGNTLAVGALQEGSGATGINGNQTSEVAFGSGAAYVFQRTGSAWAQQAYVKASNTAGFDSFGQSVALSGDGNVLVVGAEGEDSGATGINANQADNSVPSAGAVYVFTRVSVTWSQTAYLKPSTVGDFDAFGHAVAISGDGSTIAVAAVVEDSGAPGVNGNQADESQPGSGAVFVFVRANPWVQQAYLKASNPGAEDLFGTAVALSATGNRAVIGAKFEDSRARGVDGEQADESAPASGAAYVFTRAGGVTWTQEAYLKAFNSDPQDTFGTSVAISPDGTGIVIGAPAEDSAAVGIGRDPDDNTMNESGAVYLLQRVGESWQPVAYGKATNTRPNSAFGADVSLAAGTLVVGAYGEDGVGMGVEADPTTRGAPSSGAVYVYQ